MTTLWSITTGLLDARHLVLVHGSLDRSSGLLKLSHRLEDQYRVTLYDRRGYGRSNPHPGPFGIDQQVADLVDLLEFEDRRPALLVGHSYGGNVALATAARHPRIVAGVAVYESPLSWLPWWPGTTAGASATSWGSDPAGAAERFMRHLIGDKRWDRLPQATRDARRAEGPALVGELVDLRERVPWTPEQIEAPVLAMCGELGQEHHHVGMRMVGEWFGREMVVVPGARHFGPNTHPDLVAGEVGRFAEQAFNATASG